VTVVNPHTMMAIAAERIADLHRDAAPRPEAPAKAKRTRRRKRSAKRTHAAPAVEAKPR
jgi:hypothetical protein